MRIAKGIFLVLVVTAVTIPTLAQIRIIPQYIRDSVANPPTLKSQDMHFENGRIVELGSMEEDGGSRTKIIKWQNVGNSPITITRITTSCGCVRCDHDRKVVECEEWSQIEITYSPKGHPGVMRQRLFIYTDRSVQMPTAIIDINGVVHPSTDRTGDYPHVVGSLLLRNRTINLDLGNRGVQTVRIACMNGGKSDIKPSKDVMFSSPEITLTAEPETLRAGEQGEIVIRYTPSERGKIEPLRLFVDNKNLPPRDRKIEIITEKEKR